MTNLRAWLEDYAAGLRAMVDDPNLSKERREAANTRLTEVTLYLRDADEPSERQITTVGGIECMGMMGRHPSGLDTAPDVLKPCPFCGYEAAFRDGGAHGHDKFSISVECSNSSCAVRTPQHYANRETAAEAWNRRSENR